MAKIQGLELNKIYLDSQHCYEGKGDEELCIKIQQSLIPE